MLIVVELVILLTIVNVVTVLLSFESLKYYFLKLIITNYHQPMMRDEIEQNNLGRCWQEPHEDVRQLIVERMSFSGRVRLSTLCKSWRMVSMRKDIAASPQLPWLIHPQSEGCCLSFSSLSEGKVFNLRLPKPVYSKWEELSSRSPSRFQMSSKGWLIMLNGSCNFRLQFQKIICLVHPISGAQHQLPSLRTIPTYRPFSSTVDLFALSSPDISQCMVAAIINGRLLALCTPRDTSWTSFQVLEEDDNHVTNIRVTSLMFSSTGILYALVTDCLHGGVDADRTLKFGDHQVILKMIYIKQEWWTDDPESDIMTPPYWCVSALVESFNNEVLLVHQIYSDIIRRDVEENNEDVMEGNVNNEGANGAGNINNQGEENDMENNEENESVLGWAGQILGSVRSRAIELIPFLNSDNEDIIYWRTQCFRVYKFDPDSHNFHRVQNLGDQVLFMANGGSSLSLQASDFKELQGNCIYFAGRQCDDQSPHTSRDIGIFYLESGRIERSFPSFEMPKYSRLSWFTPSLW